MRQRVAHDPDMRAAAAGMLPDLVVVAGRVQPVIDIFVPCFEILRRGLRALAVAVALIDELGHVARAAIRTGNQHRLFLMQPWRRALALVVDENAAMEAVERKG